MKKTLIALTLAAVAAPVSIATPAFADPPAWAPAHGKRAKERASRDYDRRAYRNRVYDDRGYYVEPRRMSRSDRIWYSNGNYRCKRDNGTTGLVIGAGVGALAGSQIAGSGDRTLGAIIGAVGGGLIGREIDRGELKCR